MGKKILAIAQQEKAAAIGGSYVNLGSALTHPVRQFIITNLTNGYVQVSLDGGTTDFLPLAPNAAFVSDVMSNSKHGGQREDGPFLAAGSQIKVKDLAGFTAATTGKIFFSGIYEQGD